MKYFKTSEIAKLFGLHPNTVRMYEEWGLLPAVPRNSSGYRLFTQNHIDQIRLIRLTLKCTMFGRGIKKAAYQIIHLAAEGRFHDALECAYGLRNLIDTECRQAEEAEKFLEDWAYRIATGAGSNPAARSQQNGRENTAHKNTEDTESIIPSPGETVGFKTAAAILSMTPDMLRDWERNNLIHIPRNPLNGYREYGCEEINKLRVIRALRRSNYSNMAILRAMQKLESGSVDGLQEALDSPEPDAEGYTCFTDNLLTALYAAKNAVEEIIVLLDKCIQA